VGRGVREAEAVRRFIFVCLLGAALCGPTACREKTEKTLSHSDIIGSPVLDKTADQLTQTEFTAYLNHPITPGKNLIWCATMPLAWNELLDLAGGEIHIREGDVPLVTELDKRTVTKKDLDDSSYVALAGLTPNILETISRALATKFQGQASPELLGQIPRLPDSSAVAYSYLFKDLEFKYPFQKFEEGMRFHEKPEGTIRKEAVFGFRDLRTESTAKAAGQVEIHDYRNRDDFVIEIATKSKGDLLLLAKVHPDSTLSQTIQSVQGRADTSQAKSPEGETWMQVPILNFRLVKDYEELLNQHIRCSNATLNGQFFVMARQSIRFKLNEEGAKLKSETVVATTSAEIEVHETPQLIFDKPFLILMERKGAANPYFALWIDNSELLVPFVEEKPKR
jgi:hypothetical protein